MSEAWWVALIPFGFLGLGALFVVVGLRGWRAQEDFERRATARATAIVTEIRYTRSGSGSNRSTIASPVVGFDLPDGRRIAAQAMAVDHPGARWKREGVEVPVVYDPNDPTSVGIEGATSGGRILYAIFMAFGGMFALIGLLGVIALLVGLYLVFGG